MRKLTVLAMLSAGMGFGTQALADTTIGFTIYKYDDNFMSVVRQAIEKEAAADSNTRILMNDSQNSQSMQNDQVDVMLARGVQALAINLVDPAAAPTIIQKAKIDDVPVVFYNKEPSAEAMASYDKAFYVGTDSKESGIIQGDLISAQWKANPAWDKNGDGCTAIRYAERRTRPPRCGSAYHLLRANHQRQRHQNSRTAHGYRHVGYRDGQRQDGRVALWS